MPEQILITGASSDIGCELVRRLATADTVIYAHGHSGQERLNMLATTCPGRIVPLLADLATVQGVQHLLSTLDTHSDRLHKVVHLSAPRLTLKRFKQLSWDDFQQHLDVQLRAVTLLLQHCLPAMAKARQGRVVFMLSSVTFGAAPVGMAHYATAKYALLGLLKALAHEYAGKGITLNAVSPSAVETQYWQDASAEYLHFAAQQHPLKRNALPQDIVPLIEFLLSPAAAYLTGANIPVAGGAIF